MKYEDALKNKTGGKFRYNLEKSINYLRCFRYGKEERTRRLRYYKNIYNEDYLSIEKTPQNKIPDKAYFELLGFTTSDLLPANELENIKDSLDKLILKQQCNKYIGGATDVNRIKKIRTYEPGSSFWSNIAIIDFDNKKKISPYVEAIHLSLMSLNESYLMLVITVTLTEEEVKKMNILMAENYNDGFGGYHTYYLGKGKGKTGSKHKVGKSYANVSVNKLKLREKEFIRIKKLIFDELIDYFPLQLHMRNVIQPSFTLYKTNLDEIDNIPNEFYSSIGFNPNVRGQTADFKIENKMMMYSIDEVKGSNSYIIAFDKKVNLEGGFISKDSQLMFELEDYYRHVGGIQMASYLYSDFRDICISYRNQFGNISITGRKLKKLYKLRNKFYIDVNFFRNATNANEMRECEIEEANRVLIHSLKERKESGDYFSNLKFMELKDFSEIIDKEIEEKIILCRDLSDRFNISFNKLISFLSLLVAFISLIIAMGKIGK